MKVFSMLLTFTLIGICLGAAQERASTPQAKESSYQGKTIGEWIIQARDEKRPKRIEAASALGTMRSNAKVVVPVLMELLGDDEWHVRHAAAWGLSAIGPDAVAAVPALIESLDDKEVQVRDPRLWHLET